jgi:hypothetical protein
VNGLSLTDVLRERGFDAPASAVLAVPVLRSLHEAEAANDPAYALETMAVWGGDDEEGDAA